MESRSKYNSHSIKQITRLLVSGVTRFVSRKVFTSVGLGQYGYYQGGDREDYNQSHQVKNGCLSLLTIRVLLLHSIDLLGDS